MRLCSSGVHDTILTLLSRREDGTGAKQDLLGLIKVGLGDCLEVMVGAASECNALDVAMSKIRRQGDWSAKSTVPEDVYIDAQCPASDAGRRFFGWLMASAM